MKVEIIKVGDTDAYSFKQLLLLFAEVFDLTDFQSPTDQHLERVLQNESFFAIVASVSDTIVGGITCYVLAPYYSPSPQVYVFDLAVHPRYRRLGFGSRLVQAAIDHSKSLGAEEVFVQADNDDIHALEFYHATGGVPEKVTHFSFTLKKLTSR